MSIFRYIKAALCFARTQVWVNDPGWTRADAEELTSFLKTPAGAKLGKVMLNLVMRQQARALQKLENLPYEAGFATGQAALVAAIEGLSDLTKFTTEGDQDTDPAANQ